MLLFQFCDLFAQFHTLFVQLWVIFLHTGIHVIYNTQICSMFVHMHHCVVITCSEEGKFLPPLFLFLASGSWLSWSLLTVSVIWLSFSISSLVTDLTAVSVSVAIIWREVSSSTEASLSISSLTSSPVSLIVLFVCVCVSCDTFLM